MTTTSRKLCRTGHRCTPQSFIESVDCLAHHSDLSLAQVAERIGRDANYLRKACSQYDDAHPFRGDLILPMSTVTGNDVVLRYLVGERGGMFVRCPDAGADRDVYEAFAAVAQELGDDSSLLRRILDDGVVSAAELVQAKRELAETVEAVLAVAAVLEARVERGPAEPKQKEAAGC